MTYPDSVDIFGISTDIYLKMTAMQNFSQNRQKPQGNSQNRNFTQQNERGAVNYFSLNDFNDFFNYEIMKQYKGQQPGGQA